MADIVVSKFGSNPIFTPTGVAGNQDAVAVRDASFIKVGDTYNLLYTGFRDSNIVNYWAEIMLGTMSGPTAIPVRKGVIFPTSAAGADITGFGDAVAVFDGSIWHSWLSVIPSGLSDKNARRQIGHLTAAGTADVFPQTGWTFQNVAAVVGKTTGWTSTSAGAIAGVSAPKVIPKLGGGWIMFIAGWGFSAASEYQVGYATATDLNGPWTLSDTPLFGTPGGYQAEQITPFQYQGKHYLICNRLGLNGRGGAGWPTLGIDLLVADNQTGPYALARQDFIPHGAGWDSGALGVVGLASYNLDDGPIYGVYDGTTLSGAPIARSIGAFTIEVAAQGAVAQSSGGAVVSGASSVAAGTATKSQGGIRLGGAAAVARGVAVNGSGGMRLGGAAAIATVSLQIQSVASTGGVVISGESIIESTRAPPSLPLKGPGGIFFPFHMKL